MTGMTGNLSLWDGNCFFYSFPGILLLRLLRAMGGGRWSTDRVLGCGPTVVAYH